MNGMIEMAMKSLGIKPEEIKAQVEKAAKDAQEVVKDFDIRLNRIERKLNLLLDVAGVKIPSELNTPNNEADKNAGLIGSAINSPSQGNA